MPDNDNHHTTLTPAQSEALRLAQTGASFILTGGAGTGKTFTLLAICNAYTLHTRGTITLLAPTGKAARRLAESTGRQAMTIHRALGYDGRSFTADQNCIDHGLVVVDECSMLDVELFSELLARIEPGHHQLILVGDHNQLPPVGSGNVLRDLYDHCGRCKSVKAEPSCWEMAGLPTVPIMPVVELTQVMRQAGPLKYNSTAILTTGKIAPTVDAPCSLGPRVWTVANSLAEPGDVVGFIGAAVGDIFPAQYNMDPIRDVQILTPQRKGPLGVDAINELVQTIMQARRNHNWTPRKRGYKLLPCAGDKVIQRRNNYRLGDAGLFNGTLGYVLEVRGNGDMTVQWDDGQTLLHSLESGECDDIELAYALTVHQTQGSEFPFVVLVCHKSHQFMHSRNLIYTAVTRARLGIAIIGDQWGVQTAAKDIGAHERRTWIAEWSMEWWKRCERWSGGEVADAEKEDLPF